MGCRLEEPRWQEQAQARLWPWMLMERQTWPAAGLLSGKMGRGFWAPEAAPSPLQEGRHLTPQTPGVR